MGSLVIFTCLWELHHPFRYGRLISEHPVDIEDTLRLHGKSCEILQLPLPDVHRQLPQPTVNQEDEATQGQALFENLNEQQRRIVSEILGCVTSQTPKSFFIDGPGGTGKTYTYKTLIHMLRGQGKTVLSVALTGIAAKLLIDGKPRTLLLSYLFLCLKRQSLLSHKTQNMLMILETLP